ncbi:hypothetical protein B0H15DRAFT_495204 [Mycena belliarum]|uniref:Uncharacterized protein n=1 Tax=Mycena belliarum TaxID=1033014 RepID=A0AAD6XQ12_9AGAR|nr:hypothetical protein B0H15DRAFT_495204 [Mycena belliae]
MPVSGTVVVVVMVMVSTNVCCWRASAVWRADTGASEKSWFKLDVVELGGARWIRHSPVWLYTRAGPAQPEIATHLTLAVAALVSRLPVLALSIVLLCDSEVWAAIIEMQSGADAPGFRCHPSARRLSNLTENARSTLEPPKKTGNRNSGPDKFNMFKIYSPWELTRLKTYIHRYP